MRSRRAATLLLVATGVVYALFAAACFRLALVSDDEDAVSVGEGLFTLLAAAALFAAALGRRRRAVTVVLGTLPLVGWFAATPWNSGPPFLIASAIAPAVAAAEVPARRLPQLRVRG